MGMTDKQFQSWVRFMLEALLEVEFSQHNEFFNGRIVLAAFDCADCFMGAPAHSEGPPAPERPADGDPCGHHQRPALQPHLRLRPRIVLAAFDCADCFMGHANHVPQFLLA